MTNQPGGSVIGSAVAGGAIGMLVGIAAGLSTAPVIAVIVGAISTGLLILLGLRKDDPEAGDAANAGVAGRAMARVAGFGMVCTLALVGGVLLRAHDVLSPSVTKLEQGWKDAGFSDQQAREIVLYEKVGLTSPKGDDKDAGLVPSRAPLAGTQSSSLFASSSGSACPYFDRHNYSTTDDMLNAMKFQGGSLEKFAKSLEKLGPSQRDEIVEAAGGVLCVR